MKKLVTFRKRENHERIRMGDFHSTDGGKTLLPIFNLETVGQTPADFASDRSFWVACGMEDVN